MFKLLPKFVVNKKKLKTFCIKRIQVIKRHLMGCSACGDSKGAEATRIFLDTHSHVTITKSSEKIIKRKYSTRKERFLGHGCSKDKSEHGYTKTTNLEKTAGKRPQGVGKTKSNHCCQDSETVVSNKCYGHRSKGSPHLDELEHSIEDNIKLLLQMKQSLSEMMEKSKTNVENLPKFLQQAKNERDRKIGQHQKLRCGAFQTNYEDLGEKLTDYGALGDGKCEVKNRTKSDLCNKKYKPILNVCYGGCNSNFPECIAQAAGKKFNCGQICKCRLGGCFYCNASPSQQLLAEPVCIHGHCCPEHRSSCVHSQENKSETPRSYRRRSTDLETDHFAYRKTESRSTSQSVSPNGRRSIKNQTQLKIEYHHTNAGGVNSKNRKDMAANDIKRRNNGSQTGPVCGKYGNTKKCKDAKHFPSDLKNLNEQNPFKMAKEAKRQDSLLMAKETKSQEVETMTTPEVLQSKRKEKFHEISTKQTDCSTTPAKDLGTVSDFGQTFHVDATDVAQYSPETLRMLKKMRIQEYNSCTPPNKGTQNEEVNDQMLQYKARKYSEYVKAYKNQHNLEKYDKDVRIETATGSGYQQSHTKTVNDNYNYGIASSEQAYHNVLNAKDTHTRPINNNHKEQITNLNELEVNSAELRDFHGSAYNKNAPANNVSPTYLTSNPTFISFKQRHEKIQTHNQQSTGKGNENIKGQQENHKRQVVRVSKNIEENNTNLNDWQERAFTSPKYTLGKNSNIQTYSAGKGTEAEITKHVKQKQQIKEDPKFIEQCQKDLRHVHVTRNPHYNHTKMQTPSTGKGNEEHITQQRQKMGEDPENVKQRSNDLSHYQEYPHVPGNPHLNKTKIPTSPTGKGNEKHITKHMKHRQHMNEDPDNIKQCPNDLRHYQDYPHVHGNPHLNKTKIPTSPTGKGNEKHITKHMKQRQHINEDPDNIKQCPNDLRHYQEYPHSHGNPHLNKPNIFTPSPRKGNDDVATKHKKQKQPTAVNAEYVLEHEMYPRDFQGNPFIKKNSPNNTFTAYTPSAGYGNFEVITKHVKQHLQNVADPREQQQDIDLNYYQEYSSARKYSPHCRSNKHRPSTGREYEDYITLHMQQKQKILEEELLRKIKQNKNDVRDFLQYPSSSKEHRLDISENHSHLIENGNEDTEVIYENEKLQIVTNVRGFQSQQPSKSAGIQQYDILLNDFEEYPSTSKEAAAYVSKMHALPTERPNESEEVKYAREKRQISADIRGIQQKCSSDKNSWENESKMFTPSTGRGNDMPITQNMKQYRQAVENSGFNKQNVSKTITSLTEKEKDMPIIQDMKQNRQAVEDSGFNKQNVSTMFTPSTGKEKDMPITQNMKQYRQAVQNSGYNKQNVSKIITHSTGKEKDMPITQDMKQYRQAVQNSGYNKQNVSKEKDMPINQDTTHYRQAVEYSGYNKPNDVHFRQRTSDTNVAQYMNRNRQAVKDSEMSKHSDIHFNGFQKDATPSDPLPYDLNLKFDLDLHLDKHFSCKSESQRSSKGGQNEKTDSSRNSHIIRVQDVTEDIESGKTYVISSISTNGSSKSKERDIHDEPDKVSKHIQKSHNTTNTYGQSGKSSSKHHICPEQLLTKESYTTRSRHEKSYPVKDQNYNENNNLQGIEHTEEPVSESKFSKETPKPASSMYEFNRLKRDINAENFSGKNSTMYKKSLKVHVSEEIQDFESHLSGYNNAQEGECRGYSVATVRYLRDLLNLYKQGPLEDESFKTLAEEILLAHPYNRISKQQQLPTSRNKSTLTEPQTFDVQCSEAEISRSPKSNETPNVWKNSTFTSLKRGLWEDAASQILTEENITSHLNSKALNCQPNFQNSTFSQPHQSSIHNKDLEEEVSKDNQMEESINVADSDKSRQHQPLSSITNDRESGTTEGAAKASVKSESPLIHHKTSVIALRYKMICEDLHKLDTNVSKNTIDYQIKESSANGQEKPTDGSDRESSKAKSIKTMSEDLQKIKTNISNNSEKYQINATSTHNNENPKDGSVEEHSKVERSSSATHDKENPKDGSVEERSKVERSSSATHDNENPIDDTVAERSNVDKSQCLQNIAAVNLQKCSSEYNKFEKNLQDSYPKVKQFSDTCLMTRNYEQINSYPVSNRSENQEVKNKENEHINIKYNVFEQNELKSSKSKALSSPISKEHITTQASDDGTLFKALQACKHLHNKPDQNSLFKQNHRSEVLAKSKPEILNTKPKYDQENSCDPSPPFVTECPEFFDDNPHHTKKVTQELEFLKTQQSYKEDNAYGPAPTSATECPVSLSPQQTTRDVPTKREFEFLKMQQNYDTKNDCDASACIYDGNDQMKGIPSESKLGNCRNRENVSYPGRFVTTEHDNEYVNEIHPDSRKYKPFQYSESHPDSHSKHSLQFEDGPKKLQNKNMAHNSHQELLNRSSSEVTYNFAPAQYATKICYPNPNINERCTYLEDVTDMNRGNTMKPTANLCDGNCSDFPHPSCECVSPCNQLQATNESDAISFCTNRTMPTFQNCPCMLDTYVKMMKIYNKHRQSPLSCKS